MVNLPPKGLDCRYQKYLDDAITFLREYDYLTEAFVAEYFVEDLPSKLPKSWRGCIPRITLDEIGSRILKTSPEAQNIRSVWPLSLLAYIATCHSLCLASKVEDSDHMPPGIWREIADVACKGFEQHNIDAANKGTATMLVPHAFRRHVKPKKQYEIDIVSKVTDAVSRAVGARQVMDVGAGLGHLSRLLAFGFKYHVTSLEAQSHFSATAKQFDSETCNDQLRFHGKDGFNIEHRPLNQIGGSIVHKDVWVDAAMSTSSFLEIMSSGKEDELSWSTVNGVGTRAELQRVLSNQLKASDAGECLSEGQKERDQSLDVATEHRGYTSSDAPIPADAERRSETLPREGRQNQGKTTLVGLHTCGDLASTLIQAFDRCEAIRGLVLVGCCYMKLTYKGEDSVCSTRGSGKNLSSLINMESSALYDSVEGREYRCRSQLDGEADDTEGSFGYPISRYLMTKETQPLGYNALELGCHFLECYGTKVRENSPSLKLHCYRAVLEVLIRRISPETKLAPVRCKRIKDSAELSFHEYSKAALKRIGLEMMHPLETYVDAEALLNQWKDVVVFYCLRLLLGPVIESVVLLDRLLFLLEKGGDAKLVPIFDPRISPRNFALIALKTGPDLDLPVGKSAEREARH